MNHDLSRRSLLGAALALGATARIPALASPSAPAVFDVALPSGRVCRTWRYDAVGQQRGTVLFGHGAASAPWKYEALFKPWTQAGYRVLAPLHVDSTDHPDRAKFVGLESWAARIEDMRGVTATIEGKHYVAAGHSYGGLAALALGGARPMLPDGVAGTLRDPRAKLVLAFSPPGAMAPLIDAAGYAGLAVPALIQTGTADIPPGADGWNSHLLAFESAAKTGERFGLVLDGVDHYFGGAICRPELPGPKQLAQLDRAAALSLVMLRGWMHDDAAARDHLAALVGERPGETLMRR
ncbi:alpha/beta hydrolase [Blastomonas sp.]|uniref:alpha/beta hydrolase n=1 Tax=Blastomonas sp. TaxID=1909299 RepID=UPI00262245F5|nr:alpha/beta hydrolase [Blastomonas sp.]MDM7955889.1 alpha/beta hydrolase [Blastomonas sp.]